MKTEAYKAWTNLYTDEVEEVWNKEKNELKRAATILFVLEREFKRIQKDLEQRHTQFKIEYEAVERDKLLFPSSKTNLEDQKSITQDIVKSPMAKGVQKDISKKSESELETLNESSDETICASPKINRQKHFKRKKPKSLFSPLEDKNYCIIRRETTISNKLCGPSTPKLSSQIADDLIDCTVIDGTPNMVKKEKKGRTLIESSRNKHKMKKSHNGATLTQMFITASRSSTKENKQVNTVSNGPENKNSVLLKNDCSIVDDTLHEDAGFKQPKEIICKEPVVRGKKRQKLEGWDCEECRKFYEGLDLNTQDMKNVLNKCSRHRATHKPDDYTPPGYWTLAFTPTQKAVMSETENKNLTEDSTFFQF